jgi:hypothetical protein
MKTDECDWPEGELFGFLDDPGEHDPCYVVMPGGAMLVFNHHAGEGVDVARARFVQAACNAAINPADWSDLEDDLSDVISDSMDMDWTSRIGARAVVEFLKALGARIP